MNLAIETASNRRSVHTLAYPLESLRGGGTSVLSPVGAALLGERVGSLIACGDGECDALFISHRHGDRTDKSIVQLFIDAGKPVIARKRYFARRGVPLVK